VKPGLDPATGAFNDSPTATIVVRAYNRSTAGTYTQIGSDHPVSPKQGLPADALRAELAGVALLFPLC
jgi:hypothetical protein